MMDVDYCAQAAAENAANGTATLAQAESLLDPELNRICSHPYLVDGMEPDRLARAKLYILEVNNIRVCIDPPMWELQNPGDEFNFPIAKAIEECRLMAALLYSELELVMKSPVAPFDQENISVSLEKLLIMYNKLNPIVGNLTDGKPNLRRLCRNPSDPPPDGCAPLVPLPAPVPVVPLPAPVAEEVAVPAPATPAALSRGGGRGRGRGYHQPSASSSVTRLPSGEPIGRVSQPSQPSQPNVRNPLEPQRPAARCRSKQTQRPPLVNPNCATTTYENIHGHFPAPNSPQPIYVVDSSPDNVNQDAAHQVNDW
jgi:hypothetical protein